MKINDRITGILRASRRGSNACGKHPDNIFL
jgi:hypothetical protein